MDRREFIKGSLMAAGGLVLDAAIGRAERVRRTFTKDKKDMEQMTLRNGVRMPILGYGTLKLPQDSCAACVAQAIGHGYRLIDTAKNYVNEEQVGEGIRRSGIDRRELFVTSKLWFKDAGYDTTLRAFDATLSRLGTDYLDLYLIHQPFGDYYGAWRAMERLYNEKRIRAIGVSNFYPDRLVDLCYHSEVRPMVNQVEFHPYFQRWDAKDVNDKYGVQMEAWGPLCQNLRPELFNEPVLRRIADSHGATVAQVIQRFLTQQGVVTLCKTQHEERMQENLQSMSLTLSPSEIAEIRAMNTHHTVFKDHQSAADVEWFMEKSSR